MGQRDQEIRNTDKMRLLPIDFPLRPQKWLVKHCGVAAQLSNGAGKSLLLVAIAKVNRFGECRQVLSLVELTHFPQKALERAWFLDRRSLHVQSQPLATRLRAEEHVE